MIFIKFQRPSAKELLRHPFIKKAKRNNHLMDLIDRYRKWKLTHTNESDSDSEDSDNDRTDNSDSEWDIGTIKEPPSGLIEDDDHQQSELSSMSINDPPPSFNELSSSTSAIHENGQRSMSPTKQGRHRSPTKESPLKENRNVAKSESDIVSLTDVEHIKDICGIDIDLLLIRS